MASDEAFFLPVRSSEERGGEITKDSPSPKNPEIKQERGPFTDLRRLQQF